MVEVPVQVFVRINGLYPDSVGKELAIQVAFKYKPDKEGEQFLNSVSEIFKTLPYNFSYYML